MSQVADERAGDARITALRVALVAVGLVFALGVYPLVVLWPGGWSWGESHYLMMIITIYAVLGVFLLLAARDPLANRSLIRFAVWSSLAHAGTMTVQALADTAHDGGHLLGDVPALVLVAVVLAVLLRRAESGSGASTRADEPLGGDGRRHGRLLGSRSER